MAHAGVGGGGYNLSLTSKWKVVYVPRVSHDHNPIVVRSRKKWGLDSDSEAGVEADGNRVSWGGHSSPSPTLKHPSTDGKDMCPQ